jgi:hypothetical protein
MKKVIFGLSATFIIVATLFSSCSKDEKVEKKIDYTPLLLRPEQLNTVMLDIEAYKESNPNLKTINNSIAGNDLKIILQPLIENGKDIHKSMIDEIRPSAEFQNLTFVEQQQITNLSETQLVELSLIVNSQYQYQSVDWNRVRSCASFALGISGIRSLYTNTLALGTVETMIGALKLLGKRYLGYVGIALMIYDFADCVYEE